MKLLAGYQGNRYRRTRGYKKGQATLLSACNSVRKHFAAPASELIDDLFQVFNLSGGAMEVKFSQLIKGSLEIRQKYHVLEKQMHKSKWTLEEDALAFITDAALVGRLIMSYEERWPVKNTIPDLRHKIAECMWWLIVLAKRAELDPEELFLEFLEKTDKKLR